MTSKDSIKERLAKAEQEDFDRHLETIQSSMVIRNGLSIPSFSLGAVLITSMGLLSRFGSDLSKELFTLLSLSLTCMLSIYLIWFVIKIFGAMVIAMWKSSVARSNLILIRSEAEKAGIKLEPIDKLTEEQEEKVRDAVRFPRLLLIMIIGSYIVIGFYLLLRSI